MTNQHLTEQTFSALELPEIVFKGVKEADFHYCTPIQAEALPPALAGQDVAGQAQTGTGKTAAFLLATLTRLLVEAPPEHRRPNQPRALIIAPTRELAIQIHKDAEILNKYTAFKLGLVYGGTGYEQQRTMLETGVDILIGTPGRIIDYFKQHVFDLKAIQVVVLDEADRMFDLGFIKDVRFLLRRMPPPAKRLNMLFSATLSYRVNELAYEHMNNPQLIKINPDKITVDEVTETVYYPANNEKISLLIGLLRRMDATRTLVFVNTRGAAERVRAWLEGNGFRAGVLSGDVPQHQRERLLQDFKGGKLPILVATDVAARGLHIPNVSHVFNYDLPQDAEDYVHRIGRTARVGASGDAVSFACEKFAYAMTDIQNYIGHPIPVGQVEDDLLVRPDPPVRVERKEQVRRRAGREGTPSRPPARGTSRPTERPQARSTPKRREGRAPRPEGHAPRPEGRAPRPEGRPSPATTAPRGPETPAVG